MAFAMGWRRPDNVAGSSAPAVMVGFFVATGGLLFGYDTGSISGILVMDSFREQFGNNATNAALTPSQQAVIISMLSAGTMVGTLLSAPIADWLGRRKSLLVAVAVFVFGVIFQICSEHTPLLLAGRFFAGVGVGAVSLLVPLYQSEMAPKWIRGTLVCAYQFFITLGLLAACVVNLLTYKLHGSAAYRIPMGLQLTWACVLSLGLLVLPETPRFLIKSGDKEAAALSLSRLRRLDITHPALIEELAEINANHEYELSLGPDTYKHMLWGTPNLGRRTLTGCGLQILQQLTGVNFIMYYGTSFFALAGITNPFVVLLIINVVNVTSTVPGMFVVEALGRRTLLMIGAVGMAISQFTIAAFTAAAPENLAKASMNVLITFASIFIFFFAASWGPVAWVVTSEIYPLKVRAKAMSLSTSANWLLNFGVAFGTPFMVGEGKGSAQLGSRVFFIWGTFCVLAVAYVYFFVYETSRISLEQIDEMYERVPKAWHSKAFVPSWSFQQMRDFGFSESGFPGEELTDVDSTITSDNTHSNSSNHHLNPHLHNHHLAPPASAHSDTGISETSTAVTGTSSVSTPSTAATSEMDSKMLSSMANVDLSY